MSTLFFIAALAFSLGGCVALALSQPRHWEAVMGRTARPRRWLRATGWSLIAASLAIVIARDGFSFGLLGWPMLVGLGGLLTALILLWKPPFLRLIAALFAN